MKNQPLSVALISRLTSMDLRKSMDRWYLPVVTNRGLRQRPNSQTSYVPTTQEGTRSKSLTTWAGLQRRRSTTRPNSNRVPRYQSIRARTLNWPPEVEHESRWYFPVVANRGLRQWPNSWTSYVPTTQEGARHKSLTTGAGLQRQRSTTRPNSDPILESTNRSERAPLTGHRK